MALVDGEARGLCVAGAVAVAHLLSPALLEAVLLPLELGDTVGDFLAEGVGRGEREGGAVPESVALLLPVTVLLLRAVNVGRGEAERLGLRVDEGEGRALRETLEVELGVAPVRGLAVAAGERVTAGVAVG